MSKKDLPKLAAFVFLAGFGIIFLVPLLWTLLTSFKAEIEIQTLGYRFFPVKWTLENYKDAISNTSSAPIARWFLNSVLISTTHTVLALIIVSTSAYAYAKLEFKGKNFIFWSLMTTMMFPSVINLIPLYKIVQALGWVDNPLAVIVPGLGGVFNIYLVRQFMLGIPKELSEAARIDGANEWQIFTRVIVPLSKPALTVVALFAFTGSWNDFLWPSIVMNSIEKMPLTPGLRLLQGVYDIERAHLMASAIISILPTFILYLFAQKFFMKGISLSSGVKG
ncbi:MAG: carbohydrate ABC transporter permease [Bacillota bacterium]